MGRPVHPRRLHRIHRLQSEHQPVRLRQLPHGVSGDWRRAAVPACDVIPRVQRHRTHGHGADPRAADIRLRHRLLYGPRDAQVPQTAQGVLQGPVELPGGVRYRYGHRRHHVARHTGAARTAGDEATAQQ